MGRREIRESVFKLLFRIEFNSEEDMTEQKSLFFDTDEIFKQREVREITEKYDAIVAKLSEIDAMINEKTTGWSTRRMGKVDVTIIRLAVYEMLFDESVPEGVAINEAVELAKMYGQDESPAFVNGVLAKFAQEK